MRQTKMVRGWAPPPWLPHTVLPRAPRGDPTPARGPMRAERAVRAFSKSGGALAATGSHHRLDGLQGAKHPAGPHPHQALARPRLDDLGIQELRPRPPARLRA